VGTVVIVIVLAVLACAVALLAAGLVEVYAELRQVREVLRMEDRPLRLNLETAGREVAELVPDPPQVLRLNPERPSYLLVLSNTCSVCRTIGSGLIATNPPWISDLRVLVASDSEAGGKEFARSLGLEGERLYVDAMGYYSKQLGVNSSPAVLKVENGRLGAAANLTSFRQLEHFVAGLDDL
jgi:hypothetical protein